MRLLRIVETANGRWRIENSKGDVILDDLRLESVFRAEEYIRAYVSSFNNYNYEVVPLKERK